MSKQSILQQTISAIEKQFGQGAIMRLGKKPQQKIPVIPSGSPSLDAALGVGGYPKGRMIEIYGPESSGKTTLSLLAISEVQRAGGVAAFIDAEHAVDMKYAKTLGVDVDRLLLSQPDCGEQALEIAETLVRSAAIDLVIVDSVAALVPRAEIEGDMGDQHVGLQARLMSQALRKLTSSISRSNSCLIFLNQLRMKIGTFFGSPEITTGGTALKFYASVRIDIRRIGTIKQGSDIIGSRTRAKVVKNKVAPPFGEAEFDLRFGKGLSKAGELIDLALKQGILSKHGAWFSLGDEKLGQGREKTIELLEKQPALQKRVEDSLQTSLKTSPEASL